MDRFKNETRNFKFAKNHSINYFHSYVYFINTKSIFRFKFFDIVFFFLEFNYGFKKWKKTRQKEEKRRKI